MLYKIAHIAGWNNYPRQTCKLLRPEKYKDLSAYSTLIARGQGRSYGDASLNTAGYVVLTERLNRFLAFNKEQGVLTAEAGVTLAEILEVIIPAGWFLPIIPGTKFVSLGGCIATDVHGKNHHLKGSFSQYVLAIELMTADNQIINCSANENADSFWATVGGMGLTGIIRSVTLKLMPISSTYLQAKYLPAQNIEDTFTYLSDSALEDEYSVAWVNCLTTSKQLGQSIIMNYRHLAAEELPEKLQQNPLAITSYRHVNIPFNLPAWTLNNTTVNLYNNYYYKKCLRKADTFITDYENCFFPLDNITHWNRLYGHKGFIQYQCVLPTSQAFTGIKAILEKLTHTRQLVFLGVLKRFGQSSLGLLSFPMPGYTLCLDIPFRDQRLLQVLDELDEIVINHGGRIYLAKDARLKADNFKLMYPNAASWLQQKQLLDPNNCFSSSLSQRLHLG